MEWHHSHSPAKEKFKTQTSAGKVMSTIFWDRKGVIHLDFLEPGATVNSDRYVETLNKLKGRIAFVRPEKRETFRLQHDNARPHLSLKATECVTNAIHDFERRRYTSPRYSKDHNISTEFTGLKRVDMLNTGAGNENISNAAPEIPGPVNTSARLTNVEKDPGNINAGCRCTESVEASRYETTMPPKKVKYSENDDAYGIDERHTNNIMTGFENNKNKSARGGHTNIKNIPKVKVSYKEYENIKNSEIGSDFVATTDTKCANMEDIKSQNTNVITPVKSENRKDFSDNNGPGMHARLNITINFGADLDPGRYGGGSEKTTNSVGETMANKRHDETSHNVNEKTEVSTALLGCTRISDVMNLEISNNITNIESPCKGMVYFDVDETPSTHRKQKNTSSTTETISGNKETKTPGIHKRENNTNMRKTKSTKNNTTKLMTSYKERDFKITHQNDNTEIATITKRKAKNRTDDLGRSEDKLDTEENNDVLDIKETTTTTTDARQEDDMVPSVADTRGTTTDIFSEENITTIYTNKSNPVIKSTCNESDTCTKTVADPGSNSRTGRVFGACTTAAPYPGSSIPDPTKNEPPHPQGNTTPAPDSGHVVTEDDLGGTNPLTSRGSGTGRCQGGPQESSHSLIQSLRDDYEALRAKINVTRKTKDLLRRHLDDVGELFYKTLRLGRGSVRQALSLRISKLLSLLHILELYILQLARKSLNAEVELTGEPIPEELAISLDNYEMEVRQRVPNLHDYFAWQLEARRANTYTRCTTRVNLILRRSAE
ncbi:uncharacterized protein LOC143026129 [Oratosquilla oratoria]|uniref:uncharacterized protein LOC143026129 n=1 Tax=Oratosquilla oratoria TaxID=337810 RepID=UPI003F768ECF